MVDNHSSQFTLHRLLLTVFLLFTSYTFSFTSAEAAPVGKFTVVEGNVDILHPGEKRALPVKLYDPVNIGDIVRTKTASRAQIIFIDESTINIAERSRIEITEYLFEPAKEKRSSVVNAFRGKVHFIVPKVFTGEGSRYEIHTTTAVAAMRGSEGIIIPRPITTDIIIISGLWAVRNISPRVIGEILLGPYERTTVHIDKRPSPKVRVTPEEIRLHLKDIMPREMEEKPEERLPEGPPPGPPTLPVVERAATLPPPPPTPPVTPPITEKIGVINMNIDVR